ncbi:MAG TPA: hypothetical protein PLL06_17460 [Acidobacteriota bacterium]|nr:hypothetical protein [Acidobacteriota bacterium]
MHTIVESPILINRVFFSGTVRMLLAVTWMLFLAGQSVQAGPKLPSPNDLLKRYTKASGGDKLLKPLRQTSYQGTALTADGQKGTFSLDLEAPNRRRFELNFDADNRLELATGTSVWMRSTRGGDTTLIDEAARQLKAEVTVLANRRFDYKAQAFSARAIAPFQAEGQTWPGIEFISRQRAQVRAYFDGQTGLLRRLESGEGATRRQMDLSEYHLVDGIQEPSVIVLREGDVVTRLQIETVRHNTGLSASHFNIPKAADDLDLQTLFLQVDQNQTAIDDRVTNYTYLLTETRRDLEKNGQVKETTVKVYEVYPLPGRERVRKLVSVNNKPLSAKDAEEEQKRVAEFIRDNEKRQEKKRTGKSEANDDARKRSLGISNFLKVCEFINPRRESLRGRTVVVCDFRPRKGYKPTNDTEKIVAKLAGTVWIDETDKVVNRLEGRFDDDFKVAGGLLASLKKGAAFTFDQTRTEEGVWLPLREDFNAGIKLFLFAGLNVSVENRYSDYKRFSVTTKIDGEETP